MISIKVFEPEKLREDEFRLPILTVFNKQIGIVKAWFKETTKTWEHSVRFEVKKSFPRLGGVISFRVYTDDPIWNFLDQGTALRFVRLSEDWESKTKPWSFHSGPGAGEVIGSGVEPGISARHWSDKAKKDIEGDFSSDVEDAILGVFYKRGHSL